MPFVLGILLIAVMIQAGGAIRGNRIVFPDVCEIGTTFLRLLAQKKTYISIGTTMLHLLEALAASMLLGTVLGILQGVSNHFRSMLIPLMTLIRSMPMIILVILTMTMMPYSAVPFAATTIVLVPLISEAVNEGIRSIDPELTDVYRMNSGLNFTVIKHVHIPLISGYLRQAFFNAAGMGLKVAVSAEYLVQTRNSLGKAVYSSSYFLEYSEIYAYALLMILMVFMITEVPALIFRYREKRKQRLISDGTGE